ncbi:N-formylglutamate amidohydrolase [Roseovarius sp. SCSIO 43702]|uniref:N-formylglutamate amidohydrolase n=1 Tax=Roseovarius sp. SCSIO 43702 TaxID=2823043 RepID=UPI001C731199|nr:N-formylglutamate amidohydrolase [Roseovarius sp. SCSIO 43702]QYX58663.1 N-formylglutamate amidohydrolase [Roseovarius sp. SCSIO 43702]
MQAVERVNTDGAGPAVILCEHASNRFPPAFGTLGLSEDDRQSHAAWDPGARAVALGLSRALDAPLVASTVSRLVYDCNRPPDAPTAMPAQSEKIAVPGNAGIDPAAQQARIDAVYTPFTRAVTDLLARRRAAGRPTALVTIHSFTPVFNDRPRAVELGILHDSDTRLADAMLDMAHALPHRRIERNAPYGPQDGVTHSLALHALPNALPNVMIEIRNDLLQTPEDETAITGEILTLLRPALARVGLDREGAQDA